MESIDTMLFRLNRSKFRSSFKLNKRMIDYITDKGFDVIENHAEDLLSKRIGKYDEKIDGHQTPMKNHPVFIAQHATACCCRGCIEKWYHIPKSRDLTEDELNYFKDLTLRWIKNQYESSKK